MTHPIVQEALAWLESQVQQGNALASPDAVRSYLRLRLGHNPTGWRAVEHGENCNYG